MKDLTVPEHIEQPEDGVLYVYDTRTEWATQAWLTVAVTFVANKFFEQNVDHIGTVPMLTFLPGGRCQNDPHGQRGYIGMQCSDKARTDLSFGDIVTNMVNKVCVAHNVVWRPDE